MNDKQSLYLLWATILNQSQSAEVVLKNTFELFKRLNFISDFNKEYKNINYEKIEKSMITKPCLHRFPRNMSMNIWDSLYLINEKYDGKPRKIFEDLKPTESELKKLKEDYALYFDIFKK